MLAQPGDGGVVRLRVLWFGQDIGVDEVAGHSSIFLGYSRWRWGLEPEIKLGPFGHFFDLLVDRTHKPHADNAWSAGLRIGTARDEVRQRAVIEVAIESPDVVAALAAGVALPIGLYRMEGQHNRQYPAAQAELSRALGVRRTHPRSMTAVAARRLRCTIARSAAHRGKVLPGAAR